MINFILYIIFIMIILQFILCFCDMHTILYFITQSSKIFINRTVFFKNDIFKNRVVEL